MNLPAPRAVLFDWDNTLVDTWPIIHEALRRTFIATGRKPWTLEDTMARVRKSMRDSFPEIFGPSWEEAGRLYQQHYRDAHLNALNPLPGAEALLHALAGQGLPLAVVSNKRGENLRKEVEQLGWRNLFASVVGADDAARDKPHADPVHMALKQLNFATGPDIWFIGDSEIDLECAACTGCTAILFGTHASAHPEYSATHYLGFPYSAHVKDHAEALALLGGAPLRRSS